MTRPYRQRGYPHSTRVNPESETDVNVTWMTNRHFGKSEMVIVDGAADYTKCYSRVEEVVTTLHSCTITRQDYDRPKFKTEGHTETNRNHVRT